MNISVDLETRTIWISGVEYPDDGENFVKALDEGYGPE